MDLAICPRKLPHGTKCYQSQHGAQGSSHSRDTQETKAKASTPTLRGGLVGGEALMSLEGPGDEPLSIAQEPGTGAVSRGPQPWQPTQCDRRDSNATPQAPRSLIWRS